MRSCPGASAPTGVAMPSSGSSSDSASTGAPWLSPAAVWAASSNVMAGCAPEARIASASPPRKLTTTGLEAADAAASTLAATVGAGGFEIRTTTSVSSSATRRSRPASIIRPPTSSCRSRPPTPMACDTPAPNASSRQVTCWSPVPLAPTSPTPPRRTAFAKPSGTPSRMAVPQSGPITSSPLRAPSRFSSISSSIETLSLNRKTCMPRFRAFSASAVA